MTRGKTAGEARKNRRTRIYQCLEETCKQQFSATAGTIFNDSHLPLTKWFMALALIVDAKKSISAKQLQQHLGIGSYRTAWYMAHRIRKSMENEGSAELTGIVEMDETYLGGGFTTGTGGATRVQHEAGNRRHQAARWTSPILPCAQTRR